MLTFVFLIGLACLNAQVQVKGRYQETVQQLFLLKKDIPIIKGERAIDNESMALAEETTTEKMTKPYKFAENVPVFLDATAQGHWEDIKALDGSLLKVWQGIVASDDALSLSVQFEEFHLSPGAEFYIRGRDSMLGAFTPEINNKEDGKFSTIPVTGDFLGLLLAVPAENFAAAMQTMRFRINSLAHGFRPFPKNYEDSGRCNINVACETGAAYANQKRAVAMLMTSDGTRFCSGTLINNTSRNGRQLFLTANHCLIADPSRFVAIFNYQTSACNSTALPEPGILQSAQGMRLVATWSVTDFALLEIIETIPNSYNAYLAGWSNARATPSNVFGIHHPSCDVKKICYCSTALQASYWDELPRNYHWKIPKWTRGTTEPGSSGSGLFNSQGQLIGQLHGGLAACEAPEGFDLFGALTYSWAGGNSMNTRLRDHLNPRNFFVTSLGGMDLKR